MDSNWGMHLGSASTARPVAAGTESNAWDSYDAVFLNAKAGMDSVDKKKVQKVVYDMSKGSKFFNNEQRKEAEISQRIQRMNAAAASLTPAELAEHDKATAFKIAELEASRDLLHTWVHVDMDAFYAAVETVVNPSLAGKPMAVGGMSMICTANYEARKFGVRAAMPGFIARKLCPNLIFVRPDFKKYSHYSDLSRQVFKEYDPDFIARSMDEAYLDISKTCQLRNMSGADVAEELRKKVHSATGLTCSAGVGPNRLLAKVCSDINKPNGQFVLGHEREAIMAFVSSLPIRKVNGIGKVRENMLKDVLGISNCGDLLRKRSHVSALFSPLSTEFFLAVGLGIGGSETPEKEPRKSLSNERTFAAISEEHQLFQKLEELVEHLADDMQKEDLQGRTLTLKLKETGFEVRSRAITLPFFISTKSEIWEHASKLLKAELPLSLRLMGVRMSSFKDENSDPTQRTLTSFITRSAAAIIDQTTLVSNGSHSGPVSTPSTADDTPEGHGHYSEKTAQEVVPDKKPHGNKGFETMETLQKDLSKALQTFHNPIICDIPSSSRTPSADKSHGSIQTKLEDLMTSHIGLTAQTRTESCKDISAPSIDLKGPNAEVGTVGGLTMIIEGPQSSRRENAEAVADPSLGEGIPPAAVYPTTSVETTELSWERLQSGYDSAHEKVWKDSQCALCGMEVDDCLPSARQEHEDFHFAMWLQEQGDEGAGWQLSLRSKTPSLKNVTRTVVKRESNKRKGSVTKVTSPHKRVSSRPIDAFFSKAK